MPTTAARPDRMVDLYLRLSNADAGADSLERQEKDLREWAAREGLAVRTVWSDYGRSGFKKDVRRDGFDAAVRAVVAGEVGTLAVWKLDRLSRRGAGQVGKILDDLEDGTGRIVFYADGLDTSRGQARLLVVTYSEMARAESASTSTRVRSRKAADRAKGRFLGGAAPLGYVVDADRRLAPHPTEFVLMRELVRRVLSEESLLTIARDWNARNIPTRRTARWNRLAEAGELSDRDRASGPPCWRPSTLSNALRSPTLSGLMTELHTEQDTDGRKVQHIRAYRDPRTGEHVQLMAEGFEPIASSAEQARLLAVMDGRLRRYGRGMRPVRAPRSLLGALAKCASCGRSLTTFGESYRCKRAFADGTTCDAPASVQVRVLDAAVRHAWARHLAALEPDSPVLDLVAERWVRKFDPAPLAERADLEQRLADVNARIQTADDDHYLHGTLDAERHRRIAGALAEQRDSLRERLVELPAPEADISALLDPELSLPAIEAAAVAEGRDLLGLAIDAVRVCKAPRPGARFVEAERLSFEWAQ